MITISVLIAQKNNARTERKSWYCWYHWYSPRAQSPHQKRRNPWMPPVSLERQYHWTKMTCCLKYSISDRVELCLSRLSQTYYIQLHRTFVRMTPLPRLHSRLPALSILICFHLRRQIHGAHAVARLT